MQQLELGVVVQHDARISDFVGERWIPVLDTIRQLHTSLLQTCYVYGSTGTGKTHLLTAICESYIDLGKTAIKLSLSDLVKLPTDTLMALESYDLIALDDIESICGNMAWQEAVFHLLNRSAQDNCQLVFSADRLVAELDFAMPDLTSRIAVAPSFQLPETSLVEDREVVLNNMLARRNLKLNQRILDYMVYHGPSKVGQMQKTLVALESLLAGLRTKTVPKILYDGAKAIIDQAANA